jgi:hypothetical protein
MSSGINVNAISLKCIDNQSKIAVNYTKDLKPEVLGSVKENEKNGSIDTILNISKEARLKLESKESVSNPTKKSGVTSARELFEEQEYRQKLSDSDNWMDNLEEVMRLDEPETYAKYQELLKKASNVRCRTDEGAAEQNQAIMMAFDWFYRRCFKEPYVADGNPINPVTGKTSVISALENMYSDENHDTSFNCYNPDYSDKNSMPWRYNTKFNVLLTVNMLNELETVDELKGVENKEDDDRYKLLEKIDRSVNEMKAAELGYEGNFEYLRFGVKLCDDGSVTYHANYKGCEEEDGIVADSVEELMKKLMEK